MAAALTCNECEELIALAALGVLGGEEAGAMEAHLDSCERCRETARAFRRTAGSLAESLDLLEPPAELRRRLLAAVYSGTASAPRQRRQSGLRSLWRRVPQGRGLTLAGAAALAAAVAFAIVALRAPSAAPVQSFAVVAAAGRPGAHGQLAYDPATGSATLTVQGLGHALGGSEAYELWLVTAGGSARPAGFLSAAPAGDRWTAAVFGDLLRYRAVAATVEPAGGTLQPTGPPVFSVPLAHG